MKDLLQNLIQTLRRELQKYGEMLARLTAKIRHGPAPDELLQSLGYSSSAPRFKMLASREHGQREPAPESGLAADKN